MAPPAKALLCMLSPVVRVKPALAAAAVPQLALGVVEVVHRAGNLGPYWSSCEDLPRLMFGDGLGDDVTKPGTTSEGNNLAWLSPASHCATWTNPLDHLTVLTGLVWPVPCIRDCA